MQLTWRPASLAGRVALSVGVGSLVAGTIVGLATGLLSTRLAGQQEDNHLREAAATLAFELHVKQYAPAFAAAEESQELAHTGIMVAIFQGDRFLAGSSTLARVAPGDCVDQSQLRACAVARGRFVTVAARDQRGTREHREVTARAAFIAVMLTCLSSTAIALVLAHAAVKPLDTLARAVQSVPEDAPERAELGLDAGVAEGDALRNALRSAFDRLGRALAQSRSFASNAAHQLRTPLTAIIGELDLAAESVGAVGAYEVTRARRVAMRLSALIDRLLILAGPDEVRPLAGRVSLLDVVEDALDTLPEAARARIDYTGAIVRIPADPTLVVSALVSALENALKFSAGRVRVEVTAHAGHALVAVEDDGPGVPVSEQEQLFAPFFRGHVGRADQIPGHGIGLAVIARVTKAHGGSTRFAERPAGARLEMLFACPGS